METNLLVYYFITGAVLYIIVCYIIIQVGGQFRFHGIPISTIGYLMIGIPLILGIMIASIILVSMLSK